MVNSKSINVSLQGFCRFCSERAATFQPRISVRTGQSGLLLPSQECRGEIGKVNLNSGRQILKRVEESKIGKTYKACKTVESSPICR